MENIIAKITELTDDLAKIYITLNDLRRESYINEELQDILYNGNCVRFDAQRIQEEFEPLSYESENIIMSWLNDNFVTNGVDYKDELFDKTDSSELACKAGLLVYMIEALRVETRKCDERVSEIVRMVQEERDRACEKDDEEVGWLFDEHI